MTPPLNAKYLRLPHASFVICTEEVRRVSTCVGCLQAIPKGARRLTIEYRPQFETKPRKGGQLFKHRKFFHLACFGRSLEFDPEAPFQPDWCVDCGEPCLSFNYVYIGHKQNHGRLCDTCAHSPRWRRCRYCEFYAGRYSTSPVIEADIPAGHFCCDHCQEERFVWTIKMSKRLSRMSPEAREAWKRARETLHDVQF